MPKTLARGQITPKSTDKEKLLAINELQRIAGAVYRVGPVKLTTTDAAFHTVWTSDQVVEGSLWAITVYFIGRDVAGGGQIFWVRNSIAYRQPGGATILTGVTDSVTVRSDANLGIALALSGNAVTATVQDAISRTINWSIWVEARVAT